MKHLATPILALLHLILMAAPAFSQKTPVEVFTRSYSLGEEPASPEVLSARRLVDGSWLVVSALPSDRITFVDRLDEKGDTLSSHGLPKDGENPTASAVDPFGDVLLLFDGRQQRNPEVRKIEGATGRLTWRREIEVGSWARYVSLHVDSSGDALVVGLGNRDPPIFAAKLTASTGSFAWGPVSLAFDRLDSLDARASLDPRGDLLIATAGYQSPRSFTVKKVSGDTGQVLWETVAATGRLESAERFRLVVAPTSDVFVLSEHASLQALLVVALEGSTGRRRFLIAEPGWAPESVERAFADEGGSLVLWFRWVSRSLLRLQARDGTRAWASPMEDPPVQVEILPGGDILSASWDSDRFLLRRRAFADAADVWPPREIAGPIGITRLFVSTDRALVVVREPSRTRLSILDLASGELVSGPATLVRPRPLPVSIGALALGANRDVFALARGPASQVRIARLSRDTGDLLWASDDLATTSSFLLSDSEGNALFVGQLSDGRIVRLKLRGESGEVLWGPLVDSGPPAFPESTLADAALAPRGDVYIASPTWVARLDGRTGAYLWASAPAPDLAGVAPLSVDASEDVAVLFLTSSDAATWRVTKLRGADGQPLYLPKPLASPVPHWFFPAAGDFTLVSIESGDLRTTRVSGDTGEIRWVELDQGVDFDHRFAQRPIAVDASGDVYLAWGGVWGSPLTIRKRSGATGGLLWSTTWDGYLASLHFRGFDFLDGDLVLLSTNLWRSLYDEREGFFLLDARDGRLISEPLLMWPVTGGNDDVVAIDDDAFSPGLKLRKLTAGLAIAPADPFAFGCAALVHQPIPLRNEVPPVELEVVSGTLPRGLTLLADGVLAGSPQANGTFDVRLAARDAAGERTERDLQITVAEGPVTISASQDPICAGGGTVLTVSGAAASVRWRPGGQATPSVVVFPQSTTTYVVEADDGAGCARRGSFTVHVASEDTGAPEVLAPPGATVLQSACESGAPGASAATSPALAAFLAGGSARDGCDPSPRRLPPRHEGRELDATSVLPAGESDVVFTFADRAGNKGTDTSRLTVWAFGDLDLSYTLDVVDLQVLAAYLVGNLAPEAPPFRAPASLADANRDGVADLFDLMSLSSFIAGNLGCLVP